MNAMCSSKGSTEAAPVELESAEARLDRLFPRLPPLPSRIRVIQVAPGRARVAGWASREVVGLLDDAAAAASEWLGYLTSRVASMRAQRMAEIGLLVDLALVDPLPPVCFPGTTTPPMTYVPGLGFVAM